MTLQNKARAFERRLRGRLIGFISRSRRRGDTPPAFDSNAGALPLARNWLLSFTPSYKMGTRVSHDAGRQLGHGAWPSR